MKALAVFPARRTLALIDAPAPPPPGPGEVAVRTLEVGICGTDKEIARFEYGEPPAGSDYLVLGHECLGEVREVGPGVEGLAAGDLVVPRVRRPCPHAHCAPCRQGRPDYCVSGDFSERGIQRAHGFACEAWVEEARYLHPVPAALRAVGVLVEPLTIAEKALPTLDTVQARLPGGARSAGRRALVIGSGPVALLGAMALVRAGHETHVYARTPAPNPKAAVAEAAGARYVSSQEVSAEQLPARTGGAPDFVYEAAGASRTAFDVLRVLAPNGVFLFTGVPGRKQPLELDGAALMKALVLGNQVALGTVNAGPDAFGAAVEDLARFEARWPGVTARLLTHRHAPEAGPGLLREGLPGGIKHIIRFGEASQPR